MISTGIAFLRIALGQSPPQFPSDPDQFQFITSDIDRFWAAFDQSSSQDLAKNLKEKYLTGGSHGLAFFNLTKIQGADRLADHIRSRKLDYTLSRERTLKVKEALPRIKSAFYAMKHLYPESTFPPVYCVIGRHTSGGTASSAGLILGVEMSINEPDKMPYIVAHELVHFLQPKGGGNGLLAATIREGSADWIGYLASGGLINTEQWKYGLAHEAELWKEWKSEVAGKNRVLDWISTYGQMEPRPGDLGYFVGARIAEAYYNKASDKRAAVKQIIECKDPAWLLKESGYDPH